jgi:ABC-type phosphate/phosphonate transport system substrate-binding protein
MKTTKDVYNRSVMVLGSRRGTYLQWIFLLLVLFVHVPTPLIAETPPRSDLILAYSLKILPDVDPKDAMAAFSTYAAELSKGVGITVSSYVYENVETITDDLKRGKVDLVSFSALEYLRVKDSVSIELGLGSVRGGKMTRKYLLLTRENKGYTKIGHLKGMRLSFVKGDDIGPLYLSTILLRQRLGNMKDFFSGVEEKNKPTQAVLSVFFGQADACVVNDVSFKTMIEMNPQLGRDLKVMANSSELLDGMGVFRKSMPVDLKQRIVNVAKNLKGQPRGKQVLMLFKLDDLAPIQESDLSGLKELVDDYDRLTQRRK